MASLTTYPCGHQKMEELTLANLVGVEGILRQLEGKRPSCKITVHPTITHLSLAQRIADILSKIDYTRCRIEEWLVFNATPPLKDDDCILGFAALIRTSDVMSGMPITLQSIAVTISPRYADEEIVYAAFALLQHFELHEVGEHFEYRGTKPFDPHAGYRGLPDRTLKQLESSIECAYPPKSLTEYPSKA
jgi:hypothetical protein